ncbi:MAG TPA: STAS domain-containing protein [Actinomycetota bacterium]
MTELAEIDSELVGGACLVRVRGEIDLTNTTPLSAAIEHAVPAGAGTLVLDLSGTTYLDSGGVALLLRLAERLRNRRQELRLVIPADSPIRAVVDLSGVAGAMRVESVLDDALEHQPHRPDPS